MVATEEGPNPADCRATHVVKERETTSIIAECYDVDIAQIREANPSLVNITSLSIDQEILIPPCGRSTLSSECAVFEAYCQQKHECIIRLLQCT